jgi:hypothetical protein
MILRTWRLWTKDGREVFKDIRGSVTLESGSNMPFGFIEGQHPHENKEFLAEDASEVLGIECVWHPGPDWNAQPR